MITDSIAPQPYQMLALAWRPTHLELWDLNNNGFTTKKPKNLLNIVVSLEDHYYLSLCMTKSEQGWIRVPIEQRSLFVRIENKGDRLEVIQPVPGEGELPLTAGRIHSNNMLTVIDSNRLHVLDKNNQWYERTLPIGVTVSDVSFDNHGRLWVAGAVPSSRIPGARSELAIYCQPTVADEFEHRSPHLDFITAAKTIRAGGMESLRTIDAENEPLVATSDCSWFFDDPSTFLFIRNNYGRWKVKRLAERSVRKLLRFAPLMALVVTVEGDMFTLGINGRTRLISKANDLRRLLLSYYPSTPAEARFIIRSADAKDGQIAIVMGLYVKMGQYLSWLATAICQSFDEGKTWTIAASTSPSDGDIELVDVAIFTRF